jgi:hypothetical protein
LAFFSFLLFLLYHFLLVARQNPDDQPNFDANWLAGPGEDFFQV